MVIDLTGIGNRQRQLLTKVLLLLPRLLRVTAKPRRKARTNTLSRASFAPTIDLLRNTRATPVGIELAHRQIDLSGEGFFGAMYAHLPPTARYLTVRTSSPGASTQRFRGNGGRFAGPHPAHFARRTVLMCAWQLPALRRRRLRRPARRLLATKDQSA
jgi:hypothetical protein